VDYRQTSLGTLSATAGIAPITARSFAAQDTSRNIPTVYDFSVSMQRELPWGIILDSAYIGNLQRHQSIVFNLNAIPLGTAFNPKYVRPGVTGANFFGTVNAANPGALPGSNTVDNLLMRPYQGFNTINMNVNGGNLAYHSLQLAANKRFSRGLMFQTSYTLSRLESGTETAALHDGSRNCPGVLATFVALATEKTMNFRTVLVCIEVTFVAATSRAQYATGFESPTFVSGQVAGQDSWTTSANNATARVLTDAEIATELTNAGLTPGLTVHGGTQALIVSGSGASNATIRVIPGLEAQPLVRLDIWARPLLAGTTGAPLGNIFMTMEDSAGTRAAAFRFGTSFGQTIDYGTNIPSVWQPTTILWDGDTWFHLTLDVDYSTKTYNMAVNGAPVTASPIPFYNALSTSFSQVRIFRGANQAGMVLDDFFVVAIPEPASVELLFAAAAGLGLVCRRR